MAQNYEAIEEVDDEIERQDGCAESPLDGNSINDDNGENEPRPDPRESLPLGPTLKTCFKYITNFYFLAMLSSCVVMNYSWVTYSKTDRGFIKSFEVLYFYLNLASFVILVLMYLRFYKSELRVEVKRFDYYFDIRKRGEFLFIFMAIILVFMSVVHSINEYRLFERIFGNSDFYSTIFIWSQMNYFCNVVILLGQLPLVFLKVVLVSESPFWHVFFKWGFVHLMTTDICLWVQMAFGEALTSMLTQFVPIDDSSKATNLSFYEATFHRYNSTEMKYTVDNSFKIPPYERSCDAWDAWQKDTPIVYHSQSQWSEFEACLCKSKETGNSMRPFFVELCLLLAIVLYERQDGLFETGSGRSWTMPTLDIHLSQGVFGVIGGVIIGAVYFQDIGSSGGTIVKDWWFDVVSTSLSFIICISIILLCFRMRLSETSSGFEMLLLYLTTLGPCLMIFMCALSADGNFKSVFWVILMVLAYLSLIVVVGFLSGMKRSEIKVTLPRWQKLFLENVIWILACYNLCVWGRLNFLEEGMAFSEEELHAYWGLSYTVMASIAMPLYKFFHFHVTLMLFQVAVKNQIKDPEIATATTENPARTPRQGIVNGSIVEPGEDTPLLNIA